MIRIAVILAVAGATLAVQPASAQFGNIFGGNDQPPRPPADVPNGSNGFPAQPPPPGYGQQYSPPPPNYGQQQYPAYPSQQPVQRPQQSGIQSQPLAPPPGVAVAPPPPPSQQGYPQPQGYPPQQRARVAPQQQAPAPQQPAAAAQSGPAAPGTPPAQQTANPPPADPTAKPDDTIVTQMPTQKIANARAVFSGLDKITGRIISFDAAIGETVQFGALQVTARVCYTRPPTEATNTDAFVEVDEVTLKGEIKRIFSGWMFAASPGLHAVEHPIYDVWLTDCSSPETPTPVAQSTPPTAGPPPVVPRTPRQVQPAQPRRPAVVQPAPGPPPATDD